MKGGGQLTDRWFGVAAMATQGALAGEEALLGPAGDGLGVDLQDGGDLGRPQELAVLGAGRGDWCCIGTSLDALGAGGASPPPAPTLQNLVLAPCADLNGVMAPSAYERSQMTMLDGAE